MAEIASAYVSILPSFKGTGSTLERGMAGSVNSAGQKSGSRFGKVFGSAAMTPMKGLVTGIGALFAAQKIVGFFKDSITEAREAQVVTARTENVIKSMGLSSKVSASQIADMAMSISNKTAVDDEAIQSGQNLLLTFGNVAKSAGESNGIFAQTSQLMVDMSVAMGTDAKAAALQLGKALNDPMKGVTALARAGVSFTQQQKDQIATLQESGNVLGAQKIILSEVKKQFGGAAAAMATPADRAKVAWANFQEQIGTMLLPIIDKLLTALTTSVIPAVSGFISGMQSGAGAGGQFAAALSGVGAVVSTVFGFIVANKEAVATFAGILLSVAAAVKVWTIAQIALNIAMTANPIGIVVVALAALAAGLVYAYQKSETFRAVIDAVFNFLKTAVTTVIGFVSNHWQLIVAIIGGPLAIVAMLVVKHWGAIKDFVTTAVSTVINFVRNHWRLIITLIGGPLGLAVALVTKHWNTIKAVTTAVWNAVKSVISTQINTAKSVVSTAIGAIQAAFGKIGDIVGKVRGWFEAIVSAVRTKLDDAVGFVAGFPGRVLSALGNVGSVLYNKGRELIQGFINGIRDAAASMPDVTPGFDLPGIPGLAKGGPVTAGRTYLVGENGPELFTSSRSGYIVPNHKLVGATSRATAVDGGMSSVAVLDRLERIERAVSRQGREFGREINGAVSDGRRKGGK